MPTPDICLSLVYTTSNGDFIWLEDTVYIYDVFIKNVCNRRIQRSGTPTPQYKVYMVAMETDWASRHQYPEKELVSLSYTCHLRQLTWPPVISCHLQVTHIQIVIFLLKQKNSHVVCSILSDWGLSLLWTPHYYSIQTNSNTCRCHLQQVKVDWSLQWMRWDVWRAWWVCSILMKLSAIPAKTRS